jgi:hypothetical protein
MTIMATHFAVVLGAWRLRIRIDIDEPREAEIESCHFVASRTNDSQRYRAHTAPTGN